MFESSVRTICRAFEEGVGKGKGEKRALQIRLRVKGRLKEVYIWGPEDHVYVVVGEYTSGEKKPFGSISFPDSFKLYAYHDSCWDAGVKQIFSELDGVDEFVYRIPPEGYEKHIVSGVYVVELTDELAEMIRECEKEQRKEVCKMSENGKTVLVISGDVHLSQVIAVKLCNNGYTALVEKSGSDALHHMQELDLMSRPELGLIIVDSLENAAAYDGIETIRQFRATAEYKRIPVIYLQDRGSVLKESVKQAVGIDEIINKPFSPRDILAAVNKVMLHFECLDVLAKLKCAGLGFKIVHGKVTPSISREEDGQPAELSFTEGDCISVVKHQGVYVIYSADFGQSLIAQYDSTRSETPEYGLQYIECIQVAGGNVTPVTLCCDFSNILIKCAFVHKSPDPKSVIKSDEEKVTVQQEPNATVTVSEVHRFAEGLVKSSLFTQ